MTKAKKAICLIVSVVMLFGVLAVGAFANDNTGVSENGTITLTYDKTSYAAGDTVTVTVALTTDYYAATVSVPVEYDPASVTFVSGTTASELFGSGSATKTVVNDSVAGTKSCVYVGVLPQSGSGAVAQKASSVVLSTLTFTAKKAISDTSTAFGVLDDQKSMTHLAGKLYVGSYTTSDVASTVYTTGQNLTYPTITASASDPVLSGIDTGVVDSTNKYVYGVPAGTTDFTQYFTVTDGTFSVDGAGTGATLTVYKTDGTVYDTYTLIIFGDVNGDNSITAADETIIDVCLLAGSTDSLTAPQIFAADVNGDSSITAADETLIDVCLLSGSGSLDNPYAG